MCFVKLAFWARCTIAIITFSILGSIQANAQSTPTILVDVDHRQSMSLNGDWHTMIDPYSGACTPPDIHESLERRGATCR
jgi:hypothetical protein